jgi:radical SAM superfamily enzyme YgiQ (UPF0313 family)
MRKDAANGHFEETGAIKKNWRGRRSVVLVYPNHYYLGMSNLGFQAVYQLLNARDGLVCERAFLPDGDTPAGGRLLTMESGRPAADADMLAFSISFENDIPNLLRCLALAGLALPSRERREPDPLVIAGGVVAMLNPEPLARFIDCFLIGEAEVILPAFLDTWDPGQDRSRLLLSLAKHVPGTYVPSLYRTAYGSDGTISVFEPTADVPVRIKKAFVSDLSDSATHSQVLTHQTTFSNTFLAEVSRGCPHGCRFCSAGFIYRPPRFRPVGNLADTVRRGLERTPKVGLVGAAVSDLPGIGELCARFSAGNAQLSFSSLRADALTPTLLETLKASGVKTATIAPDAGSERLRRVINKGIEEATFLKAAADLVAAGIPNLKLYFMVGLPTETQADIDAVIDLCKRIKHRFLVASRRRKRIGTISISLNCFVPKPVTPFQWSAMDDLAVLKQKIKKIKTTLRRIPNIRVNADVPRWAYVQALLARGDRRVSDILQTVHANGGNWASALKQSPFNADFFVVRERDVKERLPWDLIDHGIRKRFLWSEYQRALKGQPGPECRVGTCTVCGICEDRRGTP